MISKGFKGFMGLFTDGSKKKKNRDKKSVFQDLIKQYYITEKLGTKVNSQKLIIVERDFDIALKDIHEF
jgi:hypothetical protein